MTELERPAIAGGSKLSTSSEDDLDLLVLKFPSGTRDFVICTNGDDDNHEVINPMELLGLDLAASILERMERSRPALSLVLSLCRLLVPCLEYRGNRRHLVVEHWSDLDVSGDTLFEDTRTDVARELAAEQAEDYRVVTMGEEPPENSLAEVFWDAHTELPDLPDEFGDPDMSSFVKALYFYLIPAGSGRETVDVSEIRRRIGDLWSTSFQDLDVRPVVRERRRVFKRVLAATVRLASQLNGYVARAYIMRQLGAHERPRDEETFSPPEEALLELRYGGSRALRDINLGLLIGCGPLFAELINDYAQAHGGDVPPEQLAARAERLHQFIFLLGKFRGRRKAARATERRDTRLHRADRLPGGPREAARNHVDSRSEQPDEQAALNEQWQILNAIMPRLKPRDATKLRAMIDACGDRRHAAETLGLDQKTLSRQWRQTILPNVKKALAEVAAEEGFGSLLEGRNENGEEGEEN